MKQKKLEANHKNNEIQTSCHGMEKYSMHGRCVILHHHAETVPKALAGVKVANPHFPNYGDLRKQLKGTEGIF